MGLRGRFRFVPEKDYVEVGVTRGATSNDSGGDGGERVMPAAEVARLERLFKDRLANAILCQARLEWQDFDIEAFLRLLEPSDLQSACRKLPSMQETGAKPGPSELRDAESRRKARESERQRAYERMKCEMLLLTEVLKVLGAPAEDIKIAGLVGIIKDERSNSSVGFARRVYKRKYGLPNRYDAQGAEALRSAESAMIEELGIEALTELEKRESEPKRIRLIGE